MIFKKLLPLFLLFLVGCDESILGKIQVNSLLQFKRSRSRTFELSPGVHSMDVKRKVSWGKVFLKINFFDQSDKKQTVKIKVPEAVWVPNYSVDYAGKFTISSAQSGQPFDLTGQLETIERDLPQNVQIVPCYDSTGTRLITSHVHEKVSQIVIDFLATGTEDSLAKYEGSHTENFRVEESVGPCISR